jgi:hypothetical protein
VEDKLLSRGLEGKKAVARMYGVDKEQFKSLGMSEWTDKQFGDFTKGMDSTPKAYKLSNGDTAMLRTHSSGLVWNKDANGGAGSWAEPSEMGLTPAPNEQKITNVSNKMVEALGLASVDNFTELHTAANDAQLQIDNIDRNLDLINNMPSGFGANEELLARRIADMFGDDPDEAVANAEVYNADAAQRVAKEIKAFGAGTGLSDKDREFTEQMIAGDITASPEAMGRILRIRKQVAQGTIEQFNDVKAKTKKRLGPEGSIVDDFPVRAPSKALTPPPVNRTYDPASGTFK